MCAQTITAGNGTLQGFKPCNPSGQICASDSLIKPVAQTERMAPWRTAFSFSLPHRLVDNPLLLTIGRFDGRHPSLVAATTPTQLLIHSTTQTAGGGVSLLNVGESVTCVDAGRLHPTLGRDWLLIGTAQQLRVYDVHENQDIFTVEVSDGASVVRCLPIAGHPAEGGNVLAIVGGNCSVLGFDDTGVEVFWTVTGDTVRTMAAGRVTANDAKPTSKLLIGTDDYAIRVYEREEALHEIAETEAVAQVVAIPDYGFAYLLDNHTYGVYAIASPTSPPTRVWRHKKGGSGGGGRAVVAICVMDVDGDGQNELICGCVS
ncbi:unnamed protein product [Vitrella brassicaformis CCMP3155]|uniref:Ciliary BBSome complex subunit 2 N-terminal domain-containing protein n=1 Tax=Vitrella brassicaformis (strain CCMP3155) TaxID=1169540 RepID=A0A0G4GG93_VITBC|nr:unnamed protein product [Vitrella brassicaformis CCMP3155]|eukprot:CEM28644.1 unnamed protein product [Vitrella brassicaformis CCMP3155]